MPLDLGQRRGYARRVVPGAIVAGHILARLILIGELAKRAC
jgi:hypothetical protein